MACPTGGHAPLEDGSKRRSSYTTVSSKKQ
jgi:hypothetical protein